MRRASLLACWSIVLASTGCSDGNAPRRPDEASAVRAAAVRLYLADVNATGRPGAYDRRVLTTRMGRYVSRTRLARRVAETAAAIAELGGEAYGQPWVDAVTVGGWDGIDRDGQEVAVSFTGYETLSRYGPRRATPLQRFIVTMRREQGRWMLFDYTKEWLTPEGPMGTSGDETIDSLTERVVFRNQRR